MAKKSPFSVVQYTGYHLSTSNFSEYSQRNKGSIDKNSVYLKDMNLLSRTHDIYLPYSQNEIEILKEHFNFFNFFFKGTGVGTLPF